MNPLIDLIRREIAERGPICFARFMELALYHPQFGYYEQAKAQTGKEGDFYTSVSMGKLFGELLAFQAAAWLEDLLATRPNASEDGGIEERVQLVEAGAHDGRLARDVLSWMRSHRPGLFERLKYWIIEPSVHRRARQRERLAEFGEALGWFESWRDLPSRVAGVIWSNELLDAFPVHRVGWNAPGREWFEWGVDWSGDTFVWRRLPTLDESLANTATLQRMRSLPGAFLDVLPDGFTTEISPKAEAWWREAALALRRGRLMTIDYGFLADEFFAPQRAEGTLRSYRRHRVSDDLLAEPGEHDLTAHVNFSSLEAIGGQCGLATECFISQPQFLIRIAGQTWQAGSGFGEWIAEQRRQFQTLIHPEHLGRSFKVLVQRRGCGR